MNLPLPGDPYLFFILEEGGKHMRLEPMQELAEESTKEVRHGRKSWYFGVHLVGDLPANVVQLSSGIIQFAGTTAANHKRLVELSPGFHGTTVAMIEEMGPGVGL